MEEIKMTMLLETMDGELINLAFLRSISPITGQTDRGATAYAIAGYWMADAVPLTEEPDEPVQLGYYDTEAELRHDYDRFLAAIANGNTHLFRFGSNF